MFILNKIKSNVLLYSNVKEILYHLNPTARQYESLRSIISKIDSIADFKCFQHQMELFKQKSITMSKVARYGGETYHYGYYNQLKEYAKCSEDRLIYIPALEHGVRFGETPWSYVPNNISYACQGPGRIDEIHKIDPWKPIFVLGPYIHYASTYYSEEETLQVKTKLGKVLLVFPSHSWEMGEKKEDNNLFDIVFKKYANDYDTVLVCAYWNDIDAPIIDLFAQNGATIVSAGFRNDPNFIRRLKTIISLADEVVVDDIGTNIGFCKYMNKPLYLECSTPRNSDDQYFIDNFERFHDAFCSKNRNFSKEQFKLQDELYEFFWGGKRYLKTPDEVKDIFEVLKEMCIESHYNIDKMPDFIRTHCTGTNIERRYQLLADAVSPSVWQNI